MQFITRPTFNLGYFCYFVVHPRGTSEAKSGTFPIKIGMFLHTKSKGQGHDILMAWISTTTGYLTNFF